MPGVNKKPLIIFQHRRHTTARFSQYYWWSCCVFIGHWLIRKCTIFWKIDSPVLLLAPSTQFHFYHSQSNLHLTSFQICFFSPTRSFDPSISIYFSIFFPDLFFICEIHGIACSMKIVASGFFVLVPWDIDAGDCNLLTYLLFLRNPKVLSSHWDYLKIDFLLIWYWFKFNDAWVLFSKNIIEVQVHDDLLYFLLIKKMIVSLKQQL